MVGPDTDELDREILQEYDTAVLVNENTPDTFIWHTANDGAVPVLNTLKYCEGLAKYGIPFESHLFENGRHGLSLATRASAESKKSEQVNPPVAKWLELCVAWMERRLEK